MVSLTSLVLCIAIYDGLAIDTGRQKLYYADAADSGGRLGELSTDGTGHRVLIREQYSRPRGVVIDVDNRLLSSSLAARYSRVLTLVPATVLCDVCRQVGGHLTPQATPQAYLQF